MRQLAVRLSLAGFHTLRFDYFGSGDSAGEESETDVAGLQTDVVTAMETLKDLGTTEKVTLVGLRVGANVAARTAAAFPAEIEALVLWDPILTGDPCPESVPPELRPLDIQTVPDRALVLLTQGPVPHEQASRIEFLPTPCPWVESASTSGMIPVRVIQRIEEWLR